MSYPIFKFDEDDMNDMNDMNDINDEDLSQFDLTLKKKKKKKKIVEENSFDNVEKTKKTDENNDKKEDEYVFEEYDYVYLLDIFYKQLRDKNPSLAIRKRQVIPPPILHRVGKKTMWVNFLNIISILKRSIEHVQSYISYEMSTECSVDGNTRLLIKGKFNSKNLETVLKKYIIEYVSCHMCKNNDTIIVKDSITRVSFVKCETCKSSRSINAIKKSCRV